MEKEKSFFDFLGKNFEYSSVEEENKFDNRDAQAETAEYVGEDPLFEEAVEVVLELGQASVSMLQRKLRMGYARAAGIIDEMETAGYIGPQEETEPRQVLITKQQWLERTDNNRTNPS